MAASRRHLNRPAWFDIVCGTAWLIGWVLPVGYQICSSRQPPGLPYTLWYSYQISCLFSHRVSEWPVHYLQVRFDGEERWHTLPDVEYGTMRPFGHRTRLHYFLDSVSDTRARDALAVWIRQRYMVLHPHEPPPRAVRLVRGRWQTSRQGPTGHWQKPPLESFAPARLVILHTHIFEAGE